MKAGDSMATDRSMTIGEKIKYYREKLGLTQEDVANRLNTKPQNIYKYEKGIIENIPLANIVAMAELFEITPAELAGWSNPFTVNQESAFDRDYNASVSAPDEEFTITEAERQLIISYRKNEHLKDKINVMLGLNTKDISSDITYVCQKSLTGASKRSGILKVASTTASKFKK